VCALTRAGALAIAIGCTIAIASSVDCSNASSTTTPPCKDPPASGDFSQACVDCETQNCEAEWTVYQGACADLIACEATCECDNATCLSNCATATVSAACGVAADQLTKGCAATLCVPQCESGTVSDAATPDFGVTE
jgi:hypothetical protein